MAAREEYRWLNHREWVGLPLEPSVVERCAYCDFTVSAPLEEARQAFEQHVCDWAGEYGRAEQVHGRGV